MLARGNGGAVSYLHVSVIEDLVGDFARDERVGLFVDLHVRRRRPFSLIRVLHGRCKQKCSRLHTLEPLWGQIRASYFKRTAVFVPQWSVQSRPRPQHSCPSALSLLRDLNKSPVQSGTTDHVSGAE